MQTIVIWKLFMTTDIAGLRKDYDKDAIVESALHDNAIEQFKVWFGEAVASSDVEIYEPNAAVLATVANNGRPSARVVLMKGIQPDGFVVYTNYESRKGREIAENQFVALTFWWDRLHRQVRIEGTAIEVSAAQSDEYFNSRPLGSRLSAIASEQSQTIEDYSEMVQRVTELEASHESKSPARPSNWGGYLIRPESIEFWQGRRSRLHDRILYTANNQVWKRVRLQP